MHTCTNEPVSKRGQLNTSGNFVLIFSQVTDFESRGWSFRPICSYFGSGHWKQHTLMLHFYGRMRASSGSRHKISSLHTFSNIFIHFHTFSYIFIHFHTFSYIFIHFHTFSYIFLHFPTFSYIFIHFPTFSYIFLHFHIFSYVHFHAFSYIFIHFHILGKGSLM
jgi:hypothetical protein